MSVEDCTNRCVWDIIKGVFSCKRTFRVEKIVCITCSPREIWVWGTCLQGMCNGFCLFCGSYIGPVACRA